MRHLSAFRFAGFGALPQIFVLLCVVNVIAAHLLRFGPNLARTHPKKTNKPFDYCILTNELRVSRRSL
jgi:hypothetical protein